MRTAIVRHPLDIPALLAEVERASNGASVLFLGTVRDVNDGRAVSGIEYTAYEAMADAELRRIAAEAVARFGTPDLVVEHRLGHLALGDASVAIVAAHPHRAAAYECSRWVIEELKRRVPIWKREEYRDGRREWVVAGGRRRDSGLGTGLDHGAPAVVRALEVQPSPESRVPSPGSP